MDRHAAAGTVSGGRTSRPPRHPAGVRFELARREDDPEIRRLLRENPMMGEVSVTLERDPDSFLAEAIEGDVHHTVVAREVESGRLVAVGSVSVRDAYVNGEVTRLGYLSKLRVDRAYRGRASIVTGGYAFFRALHPSLGCRLYLTSIFVDNRPARRLLERGLPGMPTYKPLETFETLLMPVARRVWKPCCKRVRTAQSRLDEVANCLARNGQRFKFSPVWTEQDLRSPERVRGLNPDDFVYATPAGDIKGCLAVWDQRSYKQAVVRGYGKSLSRWRPLINLAGPLVGVPPLPAVGERMEIGYVSHLAVDDDDQSEFEALLRCAHISARYRGLHWLAVGFASRHPLLAVAKRLFRHRVSVATLYAVHWEDGAEAAAQLDGRIPHYEVALL